jgi:BirA family biotin operon repressor/biotin-[acetyl-CoA-carboxylase] ligase
VRCAAKIGDWMSAPVFDLKQLRSAIKPFRLHYFPTLKSTNSHAAALRKRGNLFLPAIVLTAKQTAGRGRGSNRWFSPAGALAVTFAMPIEEHLHPHQLPLIAGLAIRNALAEITGGAEIRIKWPNDLVYRSRKLAGLLCERIQKADLIGLGLNTNVNLKRLPEHLRERSTSLSQITGVTFDMTDVLAAITRHLHATLKARNSHTFAIFRNQYQEHLDLMGQRVSVVNSSSEAPLLGTCLGIDDTGRLLLKNRDGIHRVLNGHVLPTGKD